MAVFALVFFGFLYADNVVVAPILENESLTNRGWDAACDALYGVERTASGDCILSK